MLVDAQVVPESVEVKIPLEPAATNWFPSADKAIECHSVFGALFDIHVAPEFVEVQNGPDVMEILPTAAANLHPSAEEATQLHDFPAILFDVQLAPESVEVKIPS